MYIQNLKLGIIIIVLLLKEEEQQIAIAFVDDTNFVSDRPECQEKMQEISNEYTSLYEVMGDFI